MERRPVYLDHHATTPVDPRVLAAMLPYFCEEFGNAASRGHGYGWTAERAVGDARLRVLELIGARSPDEIVFTSGATESNNLAIAGVVEATGKRHVITSAVEHACVLQTCQSLQRRGVDVTVVGVDADGRVSVDEIEDAIRPDTALISVMAVNNEVGTIQPIADIADVARRYGVLMHTDAAQAIGRVPLNVARDGIDLLSLSAHKIYGPKGVGALYVRRRPRPVPLARQLHGGGQERGLRSGTLNVPGIVGLGEAARLAREEGPAEKVRLGALRDRLLAAIRRAVPNVRVNGSSTDRVAGNLNLAFDGVAGDTFLSAVPGLALSGGAACSSGKAAASHVLMAMGQSQRQANEAIRIGLGRPTTSEDVELAAAQIIAAVLRLSRGRLRRLPVAETAWALTA